MFATVSTPTRIGIKNIVAATDFSRLSDRAIDYALSFARRYDSTVFATHVISPSLYATPSMASFYCAMDPLPYLDNVRRELTHRLEEIAVNAQDSGVKCVPKLFEGDIAEQVRVLSEEVDADLIVIGTRGEERLERFIMGSVAESVVHMAKPPVLTVGPKVFRRPKFEATLKHIIYATDFSSDSAHAAPYAISLAEEFNAKITLVHVMPPELCTQEDQRTLLRYFHERLQTLVPAQAQPWCEPEFIVEFGGSSQVIVNLAEERSADLIVMGARKSKGVLTYFKSGVAYQVMCHAECPVLTITGEKDYRGSTAWEMN